MSDHLAEPRYTFTAFEDPRDAAYPPVAGLAVDASRTFWRQFGKYLVIVDDRVYLNRLGKHVCSHWLGPWGLPSPHGRSTTEFLALLGEHALHASQERKALLELRYWTTENARVRELIAGTLGYTPPGVENIEDLELEPLGFDLEGPDGAFLLLQHALGH